jgi:hemolysin activation/secretion protein
MGGLGLPVRCARFWWGHGVALLLGTCALQAVPAFGQAIPRPQLPGDVQPGRPVAPALPEPPTDNEFNFSIQQPGKTPVPRAADELVFTLLGITISGATKFSAESLQPLYADLIGHDVKLADIQTVADAIENKYHEAGYTLTRAYIPPQRVSV